MIVCLFALMCCWFAVYIIFILLICVLFDVCLCCFLSFALDLLLIVPAAVDVMWSLVYMQLMCVCYVLSCCVCYSELMCRWRCCAYDLVGAVRV